MPGLYPDWDMVPLSFEVNNFSECSYQANRYDQCMSNMRITYDKLYDECFNASSSFWTEACRDPKSPMNETEREECL